jgi:prophage regulatory protein
MFNNSPRGLTMSQTILRLPDVIKELRLSRSCVYRHVSEGLLPKPIRLGHRAVGWLLAEVTAVLDARIAGQDDKQIKALVRRLTEQRQNNVEACHD